MKKKKLRPLGDIQLDIEEYYLEMADHNIQWSDYLGHLYFYLKVHLPGLEPEYEDGSAPIMFYGHKDEFLKKAKRMLENSKKE